jgi:hypothetical protein
MMQAFHCNSCGANTWPTLVEERTPSDTLRRCKPYHLRLIEQLAKPEEAACYLKAAMDDSSEMAFKALDDIREAIVLRGAPDGGTAEAGEIRRPRSSGSRSESPSMDNSSEVRDDLSLPEQHRQPDPPSCHVCGEPTKQYFRCTKCGATTEVGDWMESGEED